MIPALILTTFYAVASTIAAFIFFPWTLLTGSPERMYHAGTWIAATGLRLAGIRVEAQGLDNIPSGSCVFMSNHVSNLDPCVIIPPLPRRVSILVKKSLMKVPLLGTAMRMANFVPIDRDQRASAITSIEAARKVLQSGLSIAVFAEGTRSRDGRLLPFKKGPFYLAYEGGVPVVPISVHGTETMMRKGSARIFPGTAYVTYHLPLDPAAFPDRESLMAAVRDNIASALPRWMTDASVESPAISQ
jgi:1-acyl-sn-glycerol-3-phosphate acyltransferase